MQHAWRRSTGAALRAAGLRLRRGLARFARSPKAGKRKRRLGIQPSRRTFIFYNRTLDRHSACPMSSRVPVNCCIFATDVLL